jgi:peptidase S24-like protein
MFTTNNSINNLKVWVDQALSWLHEGDNLQEVLQRHHQQLLDMMSIAREENRANDVWEVIDELEHLATDMSPAEHGEVFLRCAVMAVDLENLKDALRLLQGARNKSLTSAHQNAVVLWMTGCIHWMNHQKVEGISEWQAAIKTFRDRRLNAQVDPARLQWYNDKMRELDGYLAEAIRIGGLPPFQSQPAPAGAAARTQAPPAAGATSSESDVLRWVSCQVSELIPAGGFGPAGFDPNPLGFLGISEVLIEDEPYKIFSVWRNTATYRYAVNINSQSCYHTARVTGTSMNAASPVPIEPGDYVLIVSRPDVDDNEIVVAGILGQDERATVKRFYRRNGKIQLKPESSDESNYNIDWEKEFDEKLDDEFKIIGVVEAVFKKKLS